MGGHVDFCDPGHFFGRAVSLAQHVSYVGAVAAQVHVSQPACLINDAVAHMQMHHESPGLGGATMRSDHWNAFCSVRSQKSPVPHLSGACEVLSISCAQTR